MEIALVVVGERHAGQEIPVRRAPFVIGRDKACQLRLGCNLVSRRHCAILFEDGRILVEDFHSTNGTFLNGEEVAEPQEVHHGDHLNVGSFEFRVCALDAVADDGQPAGSAYPETISNMSSTAPTNHGVVTGREMGLDLLKLDTTVGSKNPTKAKEKVQLSTTQHSGPATNPPDSIIVCGEGMAMPSE